MMSISVFQDWLFTTNLTMQMQSVLVLACRGPDSTAKFHPTKLVVARYRASVLKAAYSGRALMPGEGESTTFMTLEGFNRIDVWDDVILRAWFEHIDEVPHHYIMHLMHGAQIIGYKHPDPTFRKRWNDFYLRSCHDLHLTPETEYQMDRRLCDWDRKYWSLPNLDNMRDRVQQINKEMERLERERDSLCV